MGSYCTNKYWKLIWKVIFDEIFLKRSSQLKNICEGLELSRLLSYIRKVSAKYQQIFSKVSYILQKDFCCKFRPTNSAEFTRHTYHGKRGNLWEKTTTIFFLQYTKEADSNKLLNISQLSLALPGFCRGKWKKALF